MFHIYAGFFSVEPAQNQRDFCGEIRFKDAHKSVANYNKELIFAGQQFFFFAVSISNTSSNTINVRIQFFCGHHVSTVLTVTFMVDFPIGSTACNDRQRIFQYS